MGGEHFDVLQKEDIVVFLKGIGQYDQKEVRLWDKKLERQRIKKTSLPTDYYQSLETLLTRNPECEDDYPVDKTWCFCKKKAKGEMIACDNEKCKIEWFHFECVGLYIKPSGKWYCQRCRSLTENLHYSSEIT